MILILFSFVFADNTQFIKTCFQDYVQAFALPPKKDVVKTAKIRTHCLTEDFKADSEDADAVLLSQDYQESWLKHIEVKSISKTTAIVILGSLKERHCLLVTQRSKKISKIQNCME